MAGGTEWQSLEILYGMFNASFAAASGSTTPADSGSSMQPLSPTAGHHDTGPRFVQQPVSTDRHRPGLKLEVGSPGCGMLHVNMVQCITHCLHGLLAAWVSSG